MRGRPRRFHAFIVASDDAFFSDPVVRMGIPGVEYFAHPWVMNPRAAKEFLYTGDRVAAQRARELGMVNHVVPRDELEETVMGSAERISASGRVGARKPCPRREAHDMRAGSSLVST